MKVHVEHVSDMFCSGLTSFLTIIKSYHDGVCLRSMLTFIMLSH